MTIKKSIPTFYYFRYKKKKMNDHNWMKILVHTIKSRFPEIIAGEICPMKCYFE